MWGFFEKLGSFTSIYYDFVIIYFRKQAFFLHTRALEIQYIFLITSYVFGIQF